MSAPGQEALDPDLLEAEGGASPADEFLDELMPPDLDWRGVVRRHPIPAILVAAAAGYWLGRSRRGSAIADAVAGSVALGVTRGLIDVDVDLDVDLDAELDEPFEGA
jgi:hypothetical protein